MGETMSDERFQDMILHGITKNYLCVRDSHHRDCTFGLEEMKNTIKNNIFVGSLSRHDHGNPSITGRGAVIQMRELSDVECHSCSDCVHFKKKVSTHQKLRTNGKKDKTKGGHRKWCSYHESTMRNNTKRYPQGAKEKSDESGANCAKFYSPHTSTCPNTESEMEKEEDNIGFTFAAASSSPVEDGFSVQHPWARQHHRTLLFVWNHRSGRGERGGW